MEIVDGAERIVESNNGAWADILLYLIKYLFACEAGIIVACHEIPHYDAIAFDKSAILLTPHEAMRRAKEVGAEEEVCLIRIGYILFCTLLETL